MKYIFLQTGKLIIERIWGKNLNKQNVFGIFLLFIFENE
jgi:hypothetical protein